MPGGRTVLMMAAMFNRCDTVDLLRRHGARADARDAGGLTALDVARITGAPDTPQQIAAALGVVQS
jgi:ankyrin repeat protein